MNIIIVEDEELSIRQFELECEDIPYVQLIGRFYTAEEAIEYASSHKVEAAFLDIHLPGMNGINLAKKLQKIIPKIVIVFITGYDNYKEEAWKMKADYYLLKPYRREDLLEVLENVRLLVKRQRKRVYIRTFGEFEVIIDGEAVFFGNSKAKELFALCVDHRGANVTMEEAIDKLWENRAYDEKVKNLYRKAVMTLRNKFREYHLEDIFIAERGVCRVNCENVDCDYLELMEEDPVTISRSMEFYLMQGKGNYMPEYSWAEETNARFFRGGRNKWENNINKIQYSEKTNRLRKRKFRIGWFFSYPHCVDNLYELCEKVKK